MAKSPAHRFGQIIGDLLENAMIEYFFPIAQKHNLYLDYRHPRAARNHQSEVRWTDINGNTHKLDIVMESNGSDEQFGHPRAFIEIAWRRYTKHSKNKAQEISAAINPLISKYRNGCPFFGAILAGDFTSNSLAQLRSEGFHLLHFSLDAIQSAFMSQGIDTYWEESTSEDELQRRIDMFYRLDYARINLIKAKLIDENLEQLLIFRRVLELSLERNIERICISTMYSSSAFFRNIDEACKFLSVQGSSENMRDSKFCYYEVMVTYTNGDKVEFKFKEQQSAIITLKSLV